MSRRRLLLVALNVAALGAATRLCEARANSVKCLEALSEHRRLYDAARQPGTEARARLDLLESEIPSRCR